MIKIEKKLDGNVDELYAKIASALTKEMVIEKLNETTFNEDVEIYLKRSNFIKRILPEYKAALDLAKVDGDYKEAQTIIHHNPNIKSFSMSMGLNILYSEPKKEFITKSIALETVLVSHIGIVINSYKDPSTKLEKEFFALCVDEGRSKEEFYNLLYSKVKRDFSRSRKANNSLNRNIRPMEVLFGDMVYSQLLNSDFSLYQIDQLSKSEKIFEQLVKEERFITAMKNAALADGFIPWESRFFSAVLPLLSIEEKIKLTENIINQINENRIFFNEQVLAFLNKNLKEYVTPELYLILFNRIKGNLAAFNDMYIANPPQRIEGQYYGDFYTPSLITLNQKEWLTNIATLGEGNYTTNTSILGISRVFDTDDVLEAARLSYRAGSFLADESVYVPDVNTVKDILRVLHNDTDLFSELVYMYNITSLTDEEFEKLINQLADISELPTDIVNSFRPF